MTMIATASPVVTRVPAEVGADLPDPWTWWQTDGRTHVAPAVTHWWSIDRAGMKLTGRSAWRQRGRDHNELWADVETTVQLWLGGDERATQMIEAMPAAWRNTVLSKVGYNAPAHADVVGGHPREHQGQRREAGLARYLDGEPPAWREDGPGPDDDRHFRPWEQVHETVDEDAVQLDGKWWHPADIAGLVRHDGAWWDVSVRIARAPAGTPLPDGWEPVTEPPGALGDTLMMTAPAHMGFNQAMDAWLRAQASEMTTVVVSDPPDERGRVEVWTGIGGHARSLGRHPDREQAVAVARAKIEASRAEMAWVAPVLGGWPEIEVIDARSPGHDAVAAARA